MSNRTKKRLGVSFALLIGSASAVLVVGPRFKDPLPATETRSDVADPLVQVAGEQRSAVRLAPSVVKRLPITTSAVQASSVPLPLELSGTLMLDADALSHVHTRFAGEVVEVGKRAADGRPLAFGMSVRKGQLLAVIWSRELGEKKSELVDALSHLWLDEETLSKLLEISLAGAVPERTIREARHEVAVARVAVALVERTMEAWRLSQGEVEAVHKEAERLRDEDSHGHRAIVSDWARIEVRAPLEGVIMERNFSVGDLVETGDDLFLVAGVNRLRVAAHAYEENLSALDALSPAERRWSLAVPADPTIALQRGEFEQIGRIIDPNQHTALVMGWVDNAQGQLRVGQFVTATIDLPTGRHEVAVPATAVVDEGSRALVFVQADPHQPVYARRQVAVTRRAGELVLIQGQPTADERARGASPLAPGELVVVSGTVQLASSLRDLQTSAGSAQ